MNPSSHALRLSAAALLFAAPLAQAGYYQWDSVKLPADSGAACGDGSPYRFFVNRTPKTKDTIIVFEGGGACWDQKSCLGKGSLSANNPDGIPGDYMSDIRSGPARGLITPFAARNDPFQKVRTQSWNIVYMPYCTGDVHMGSKVRVYDDANPDKPRVEYHRGLANAREAARWLRSNVGKPAQLVITGFSAGGAGATATYPVVRDMLEPTGRASLLADSGPLFPAPRGASAEQYPSLPLHTKVRSAWGMDTSAGIVKIMDQLPGFDRDDLGSIGTALAQRYPDDRFGYMAFQADGIFSDFSYTKFFPEIAATKDDSDRAALLNQRWRQDLGQWVPQLATQPNIAWHLPFYRKFVDSHTLTTVDFSGTGIEERGIKSLTPFIDNTLDRGTPMRNVEADQVSDKKRKLSSTIWLFELVDRLF